MDGQVFWKLIDGQKTFDACHHDRSIAGIYVLKYYNLLEGWVFKMDGQVFWKLIDVQKTFDACHHDRSINGTYIL